MKNIDMCTAKNISKSLVLAKKLDEIIVKNNICDPMSSVALSLLLSSIIDSMMENSEGMHEKLATDLDAIQIALHKYLTELGFVNGVTTDSKDGLYFKKGELDCKNKTKMKVL